MNIRTIVFMTLLGGVMLSGGYAFSQSENASQTPDSEAIPANKKLLVLWTSGDRDVALKMVGRHYTGGLGALCQAAYRG